MSRSSDARLSVLYASYFGAAGVVGAYLSLYLDWRGLSAVQIGIAVSLMQAMRVVGPSFWAHIADALASQPSTRERGLLCGRVAVLRWTSIASLVAFAPMVGGSSFTIVLAVCAIFALFQTAQMPVVESIVCATLVAEPQAASIYGRLRAWGSIGFVVVVSMAGLLFDHVGVRWHPYLAVTLLFATVVSAWRVREPLTLNPRRQANVPVMARLRQPVVLWFFLSCALMVASHGALYTYLSLYLRQLGYSTAQIGSFWVIGVLAEIALFRAQGVIFRRFKPLNVIAACCLVASLRFVILGRWAEVWPLLLLAQLLHAATFAAHHSAAVLTVQRWFPGAAAARGQGLYNSIAWGAGATLGSLIAAWLWSRFGSHTAFYVMSMMALAGMLAAHRALAIEQQDQSGALAAEPG